MNEFMMKTKCNQTINKNPMFGAKKPERVYTPKTRFWAEENEV
jgi:hypothetical protein